MRLQIPGISAPGNSAAHPALRVTIQTLVYRQMINLTCFFDEKALEAQQLAEAIIDLYKRPEQLKEMSARAGSMARPNAAKDIVDEILRMAGDKR